MTERAIVLWLPDWPVVAAAYELALDPASPIALVAAGEVVACSAAARAAGVQRGLRHREAQYRCPNATVLTHDAAIDARVFDPVVQAVEAAAPGVQLLRPGLLALRARGPARYYGGEQAAAEALLRVAQHSVAGGTGGVLGGGAEVRLGCADGLFAAEHAARSTSVADPIRLVPPGTSREFVAPLPVDTVVPERTAILLRRLGIVTLGEFAALEGEDVQRRFGSEGRLAYERACGREPQRLRPRQVPPEFTVRLSWENAIERSDQLAFALREAAGVFEQRLFEHRLVCTSLRIELLQEDGGVVTRSWLHPRWFRAAEVVDRARWQLDALPRIPDSTAPDEFARHGIVHAALIPERVDALSHHEAGLWGGGPDERIHHALSRVQSLLGHEQVGTAVLRGGRALAERQLLVPWGDAPPRHTRREQPWPGALSELVPASVMAEPVPVELCDQDGQQILVSGRGEWSSPPAQLRLDAARLREVTSWAGPWPVQERWWDPGRARQAYRAQLIDATGDAWLLIGTESGWCVEGRYD